MPDYDSPACRLLKILRELKTRDGGKPIKDAWCEVLEVPADPTFFRAYASVVQLAADARDELRAAGGSNPDIFIRRFGKVDQVFQRAWGEPMRHVHGDLDETTMEALELGVHRCCELAPVYAFGTPELEQVRASAEQLREIVSKSTLPNELRAEILRHIFAVEEALRQLRVTGLAPVKTELEATVGAISIAAALNPEIRKEKSVLSVMDFVKNSLVVLTIVKTTVEVGKLLADGAALLLH